jgi:ketosteroid isomerase-like protein
VAGRPVVWLTLVVLGTSALVGAGGAVARGDGNVLKLVRRANLAYHNAVAARDAGAVARLYTKDGWYLAENRPPIRGRAAIEQHFESLFGLGLCSFTLSTKAVDSGGKLVVAYGSYVTGICPPGGQPFEISGKYVLVYQRRPNAKLQIQYDSFSANAPAS